MGKTFKHAYDEYDEYDYGYDNRKVSTIKNRREKRIIKNQTIEKQLDSKAE